jgi:putative adhesin Stv-like protein
MGGDFTSLVNRSQTGVWFLGHGSYNSKTDAGQRYTVPEWLTHGVYFWCPDEQSLKGSVAFEIMRTKKLVEVPGLLQQMFAQRYPNTAFRSLPEVSPPGTRVRMYRLTNADEIGTTQPIAAHPNVITVPQVADKDTTPLQQRSRTIQELIEGNAGLIRENGHIVHWLACRVRHSR